MTRTEIKLDLTDVTAKKDSIISIENQNQVSNIDDVRQGISFSTA